MKKSQFDELIAKEQNIFVLFMIPDSLGLKVMDLLKDKPVLTLHYDEHRSIANFYSVRKLPTILVFKNGQYVKQLTMPIKKEELVFD